MKTKTTWLAVLAVVAALTSAQTFGAQSRYQVTDLGTLPGLRNSFVWGGVNNLGHVAAYATDSTDSYDDTSSFLWKGPGDIQLLPGLPGATTTVAFGLNDLDQVVGGTGPTAEGYLAVLWEGGNVRILGKLPGDTDSDAMAINNSGLVIGHSQNYGVDPFTSIAVYWSKGKISALPLLDGAVSSDAISVNDQGEIVGACDGQAVLWSTFPKDSVVALGTLGGDGSFAAANNNSGQIVGSAQTVSGEWHPVLWNGSEIIDLQNLDKDPAGSAFWINSVGQIVGFSGPDINGSRLHNMHALLWENGQVINLQTQIPGNSGWVLRQATGINDRGQITGIGQHNGKNRVFLLTPVTTSEVSVTDSTDLDALASAAMSKKPLPPPAYVLWPSGAELLVTYYPRYPSSYGVSQSPPGITRPPRLSIAWPIANGADHYRLTIQTILKRNGGGVGVVMDRSPISYVLRSDGLAHYGDVFVEAGCTYLVIVTAYAGPDEAAAYSESLQTRIATW